MEEVEGGNIRGSADELTLLHIYKNLVKPILYQRCHHCAKGVCSTGSFRADLQSSVLTAKSFLCPTPYRGYALCSTAISRVINKPDEMETASGACMILVLL